MAETTMSATPNLDAVKHDGLEALNAKLDALSRQMEFLVEQVEEMRRQREFWSDLGRDLSTVAEDVYMLAVEQLEEASDHVQLEDIWRLGLRFLQNIRLLEQFLQELETVHDLMRDMSPVAHDAFVLAVEKLDEMEKKGYFTFMREMLRLLDAVVTQFSAEELRALTESLVSLAATLKQLLRPEMVARVQQLLTAYQQALEDPEGLETSTWALVRRMRDPDVRRGLALSLQFLKILAQSAAPAETPTESSK